MVTGIMDIAATGDTIMGLGSPGFLAFPAITLPAVTIHTVDITAGTTATNDKARIKRSLYEARIHARE